MISPIGRGVGNPGCSLVDLKNEVHTFYSGSTSHPQSKRIHTFLNTLGDEIKTAGYVPDTKSIHDVEADVKQQLLNSHSDKLAVAFGTLNTTPGATTHIRKNLRVCGDCHNATKYISVVTKREIIARDMRQFITSRMEHVRVAIIGDFIFVRFILLAVCVLATVVLFTGAGTWV